jgi:hypothetical protein
MKLKYCQADVIKVEVLKDYTLHLQFDDGSEGNVDISALIPFEGVFEPLKDKTFFSRVTINPDIGTICWENGADLSPTYLYENIQPIK